MSFLIAYNDPCKRSCVNLKPKEIMNTETLTVHPKEDDFEIIVEHDQTGSAYGITLSKSAHEQLRLHFVVGQSEQCVLHSTDWNGKCFKCEEQVFVREEK